VGVDVRVADSVFGSRVAVVIGITSVAA